MEDLCVGGPISKRDRDNIRPFHDEYEKIAYRWRLLSDAALQEDTARTPFPLSDVNFENFIMCCVGQSLLGATNYHTCFCLTLFSWRTELSYRSSI